MSDATDFLDRLHELVKKLDGLLDNRELGVASWYVAVSSLVNDIIDLWRTK